jgi:hypothetical protein
LVVLDVFFYMGALALELWALVRLRKLRPQRSGLFVIGGGRLALAAIVIAPVVTWVATFGFALYGNGGTAGLIVSLLLAVAAWPAYWILRRLYGGPQSVEVSADAPGL